MCFCIRATPKRSGASTYDFNSHSGEICYFMKMRFVLLSNAEKNVCFFSPPFSIFISEPKMQNGKMVHDGLNLI